MSRSTRNSRGDMTDPADLYHNWLGSAAPVGNEPPARSFGSRAEPVKPASSAQRPVEPRKRTIRATTARTRSPETLARLALVRERFMNSYFDTITPALEKEKA